MTPPTKTNGAIDRFFAKVSSGGLILRSLVLFIALIACLLVSLAVAFVTGAETHWGDWGIAFGLLATAFCAAQWIDGIPVDPQLMLARLTATTLIRLGVPLAGIVLLDRVIEPGFLAHTLVFWLVGFSVGLLTSSLISLGRLSHET